MRFSADFVFAISDFSQKDCKYKALELIPKIFSACVYKLAVQTPSLPGFTEIRLKMKEYSVLYTSFGKLFE